VKTSSESRPVDPFVYDRVGIQAIGIVRAELLGSLHPAVEELFDLRKDPAETTDLVNRSEAAGQLGNLRATYDASRQANPSTYTYETYG